LLTAVHSACYDWPGRCESVPTELDLGGTFLGVWLAHTAFGLPLAVYLLRNYIGSLPRSIVESAKMDGADHFTIFWRLIIPLSVPALAAFAIFQFLGYGTTSWSPMSSWAEPHRTKC
jgi:ABC-type glycerol-3-phosphate transport system permease component